MKVHDLIFKLSGQVDSSYKNFVKENKKLVGQMENLNKQTSTGIMNLKNFAGMAVGGGIIAGLTASINTFMDFEDQMLRVKSISGATEAQYKALTESSKELGRTTAFSATQVAEAQEYYAMAGYSVEQINKSLRPTLNLASASGEELGIVADIVSDSMSAFGLSADKTEEFADILAATATGANTSVSMMGESFKYAAPVANAFGLEVKDTARLIGIMANNGIKASQSGTTLRSALTSLNKVNNSQLKELGIDISDFGNADTMGKMKLLQNAFKGLTGDQKAMKAETIFGKQAYAGMLTILTATEEATSKLDNSLNNYSGSAERMAKINESGLGGSLRSMKSALEGISIEVGANLAPTISNFAEDIVALTGFLSENWDAVSSLTGAAITMFGVFKTGMFIQSLIGVFNSMSAAYATASAAQGGLTVAQWAYNAAVAAFPGTWIVAAIAAVAGAIFLLWKNFDKIKKWFSGWKGKKDDDKTAELDESNWASIDPDKYKNSELKGVDKTIGNAQSIVNNSQSSSTSNTKHTSIVLEDRRTIKIPEGADHAAINKQISDSNKDLLKEWEAMNKNNGRLAF
ncbi:phage tail tape measure protein [Ilyobacter polytropus]|uniref:Phage tail tape measure protein, TP901 family n=1 Tax=Ilyobacter polytropus (strain ATCC 51220 / DSM 2926 / LMG 16218 / CuHBu1) TaxID=572544 RepID=E3HBL2_ILYPC|nr:phage tail tape measure protein [Ilyobacter polytropus]ADO83708.1 phage tail tape measure protein, TP901 family [Ilyobacter polytropus DSM 2926]